MTSMTRRGKEKLYRQEQIIQAAERVFFSKGIRGTTMDDIAREAEYSKRSLYSYFKTKEEIYQEIIRRAHGLLYNTIASALAKHMDECGFDMMVTVGRAFVYFTRRFPNHYKAIAMHQILQNDGINEDREEFINAGEQIFDALMAIVKKGKADHSMHASLDELKTAYMIYISVVGLGTILRKDGVNFFDKLPSTSDALVEEMVRHTLRSLSDRTIPDNLSLDLSDAEMPMSTQPA